MDIINSIDYEITFKTIDVTKCVESIISKKDIIADYESELFELDEKMFGNKQKWTGDINKKCNITGQIEKANSFLYKSTIVNQLKIKNEFNHRISQLLRLI